MLDLAMASTSVVDELNESITKPTTSNQTQSEIGNNGVCDAKIDKSAASGGLVMGNGEEIEIDNKPVGTSPKLSELPSGSASPVGDGISISPTTTKGFGLKKWRRRRRDFSKDDESNALDSNKNLKRGLPNAKGLPNPEHLSSDIKQMNEGSFASTDSFITTPTMIPSGFANINSRLAQGSVFAFGTDSDNSEDQSSKSSTAASAPRLRYAKPIIMGFAHDKSKGKKYTSGESSGGNAPQLGKAGPAETSKKFRGDKVKIEKDNSYSSVESDLRSSHILFPENGSFSGITNGRQTERSTNYEGLNSFEAQESNRQSSEEVRMDSCKDNEGEADDNSQIDEAAELSWEEKEEESINHQPSTSHDPFTESFLALQAVQEALQEEIHKFRELGKEHTLLPDDLTHDLDTYDLGSTRQLHFEEVEKTDALPGEGGLLEMKHKIYLLEEKLEDALYKLEVKESMVAELEDILRRNDLPKGESGSKTVQEEFKEMEVELESLFRQKIEAELEYMAITRTTQEMKVAMKDQIKLLEGDTSLIGEHQEILHKVIVAETSVVPAKKKGEEPESSHWESVHAEEVLETENRVCRYALCFFVQLILLLLAFLFLQLPNSTGTVPT